MHFIYYFVTSTLSPTVAYFICHMRFYRTTCTNNRRESLQQRVCEGCRTSPAGRGLWMRDGAKLGPSCAAGGEGVCVTASLLDSQGREFGKVEKSPVKGDREPRGSASGRQRNLQRHIRPRPGFDFSPPGSKLSWPERDCP